MSFKRWDKLVKEYARKKAERQQVGLGDDRQQGRRHDNRKKSNSNKKSDAGATDLE